MAEQASHAPPPIDVPSAAPSALTTPAVKVSDAVLRRLDGVCPIDSGPAATADASRDWWPLSIVWATQGRVPSRPAVVASPTEHAQVVEVLRICDEASVPVTTAAGRSGVCGAAVPVHGGLVLDMTGLGGVRDVRVTDRLVDVGAGTFGDDLEAELGTHHGVTVGHWPQSIALSTVGGWLACRSAGQLSNRYGTIADIVAGIDVVLADGTSITTDQGPRAAVGPDLTQLFVGSEGTLGVITAARLRVWPSPAATAGSAYGFERFSDGLEVCRRLVQRRRAPAVLRLYDRVEAERNFDVDSNLLLVRDEASEPTEVEHTMAAVADECTGAVVLDPQLVEQWMAHRNDVSALGDYIANGVIVDTMEVAGPWSRLDAIYEATCAAVSSVAGTAAVSAHQSHAYPDGACLYFTFGGISADADAYYVEVWDAATNAVLENGGTLSHHHGVGINRARFLADALGNGHAILVAMKQALDPHGILNPGKLALPDPFGPVIWP